MPRFYTTVNNAFQFRKPPLLFSGRKVGEQLILHRGRSHFIHWRSRWVV